LFVDNSDKNGQNRCTFTEVIAQINRGITFWNTLNIYTEKYVRLFVTKTDNIKYKREDRDRKNRNQIKKAYHTT